MQTTSISRLTISSWCVDDECVATFAKRLIFVVICIYPKLLLLMLGPTIVRWRLFGFFQFSFVSFFSIHFCLLLQNLRNVPNLWRYSAALSGRRRSHTRADQLIDGLFVVAQVYVCMWFFFFSVNFVAWIVFTDFLSPLIICNLLLLLRKLYLVQIFQFNCCSAEQSWFLFQFVFSNWF